MISLLRRYSSLSQINFESHHFSSAIGNASFPCLHGHQLLEFLLLESVPFVQSSVLAQCCRQFASANKTIGEMSRETSAFAKNDAHEKEPFLNGDQVTAINSKNVNNNHQLKVRDLFTETKYEDAIAALNGLQSNASVIEKARTQRSSNAMRNITHTRHYLKLCKVENDAMLNKLKIIHIAGTKGKGSTAAFAESILRNFGYRTGFYSSPHLVATRERIRIDGAPLSKDSFTHHFWLTYNAICENNKLSEEQGIPPMPPYFMFLTIMAFNTFVRENVDVAIVEVGIGGEYDCTNIIEEPYVVGITSLGIDHTAILGNTIGQIAWQKAGIFKKGVPAFTVDQEEDAMKVLRERAQERNCPLLICPPLKQYNSDSGAFNLGIPGIVQNVNASLALQLCNAWLEKLGHSDNNNCSQSTSDDDGIVSARNGNNFKNTCDTASVFPLNRQHLDGLASCTWPGRYQTLKKSSKVTYFLDGAHTPESLQLCKEWFMSTSATETEAMSKDTRFPIIAVKVLLFNCTGLRNTSDLMSPLAAEHFDVALFSPNNVHLVKSTAADSSNFMVDLDKELATVASLRQTFTEMYSEAHGTNIPTEVFQCLSDVVKWITNRDDFTSQQVHVLVTGSLHLVGGVLGLIDPELASFNSLKP